MRNRNRAGSAQPPARCQLTLIASRVHRTSHFWCGSVAATESLEASDVSGDHQFPDAVPQQRG